MLLAVIADTHLPRGRRALPTACVERLVDADLILHAGDFVTAGFLRELEELGPPVAGVHGNVDEIALRHVLPPTRTVRAGDLAIALVHDAGPRVGRLARMRRKFPDLVKKLPYNPLPATLELKIVNARATRRIAASLRPLPPGVETVRTGPLARLVSRC
jgi:hypothetical protein